MYKLEYEAVIAPGIDWLSLAGQVMLTPLGLDYRDRLVLGAELFSICDMGTSVPATLGRYVFTLSRTGIVEGLWISAGMS